MDFQYTPQKDETSLRSVFHFLLWLVILICANYLYIEFLFK